MNESAEYTRLLAQAYSKLADDYVAMTQRVIDAEARFTFLKNRFDDLACQIEDSRYYGKTSATGPTKFLFEIADRCRVTLELVNHVGGAK